MKQYIYILVSFVLLFSACSEYEGTLTQTKTEPTTSLAFSYEVPAALSRAAIVAASDLEKAVYDLSIFAFDQDGTFVALLTEGTDYKETITGSTATLDVTSDFLIANIGQTLVFYFVANDATSKGGIHTDAIDYANLTASQVENSLCAPLPSDDGKSEALEDLRFYNYPPYMSEGLLMTAKSEPIYLIGRQHKTVTLIRRTARFDIRNDFKENYEMAEIQISDAPMNGQLFGTGSNATLPALRSYRMMYGPEASEYTAANEYTGLFYLYPCTLGDGETEISILVTRLSDNATSYARLKGTTTIKANKRYILVFSPVNMTFTLESDSGDYDDGNNP